MRLFLILKRLNSYGMPKSPFATEISDEVSSIKVQFRYPNDGTAFGHFILRECLSKVLNFDDVVAEPDLDEFVQQSVTDGKDDKGIDAVIVGEMESRLICFNSNIRIGISTTRPNS